MLWLGFLLSAHSEKGYGNLCQPSKNFAELCFVKNIGNDAGVTYNFSKLLDSDNISTREDTLRCNYCFLLITRSKLYLWRDKKIVLLLVYMYI